MSRKPDRLVLLDVDGTLAWAEGAGRAALSLALGEIFGLVNIASYEAGGHTMRAIILDILGEAGIPESQFAARRQEFNRALALAFERLLHEGAFTVRACPGGPELANRLHSEEQVLPGLLTGNPESIARGKLRAAGYEDGLFVLGAYGDEHPERAVLLQMAIQRAEQRTGSNLAAAQVVVIGDTKRDVEAAQAAGARSIAVATGDTPIEQLRDSGADLVIADLRDSETILAFIRQ